VIFQNSKPLKAALVASQLTLSRRLSQGTRGVARSGRNWLWGLDCAPEKLKREWVVRGGKRRRVRRVLGVNRSTHTSRLSIMIRSFSFTEGTRMGFIRCHPWVKRGCISRSSFRTQYLKPFIEARCSAATFVMAVLIACSRLLMGAMS
jgi:hypothetical protein